MGGRKTIHLFIYESIFVKWKFADGRQVLTVFNIPDMLIE